MEWWDWWDRRTCYSLNILIWAAFTTDGASNHWHCVRHILPPTGIICAPNWKSASLAGGGAFATVSPYLYFCLNSISMQSKSSQATVFKSPANEKKVYFTDEKHKIYCCLLLACNEFDLSRVEWWVVSPVEQDKSVQIDRNNNKQSPDTSRYQHSLEWK